MRSGAHSQEQNSGWPNPGLYRETAVVSPYNFHYGAFLWHLKAFGFTICAIPPPLACAKTPPSPKRLLNQLRVAITHQMKKRYSHVRVEARRAALAGLVPERLDTAHVRRG